MLRGFFNFVVGEMVGGRYCYLVGVLAERTNFISLLSLLPHGDTDHCDSCCNVMKTAYVKHCFL